eukprot:6195469-Pleurochrysis_carterae.AAC.1
MGIDCAGAAGYVLSDKAFKLGGLSAYSWVRFRAVLPGCLLPCTVAAFVLGVPRVRIWGWVMERCAYASEWEGEKRCVAAISLALSPSVARALSRAPALTLSFPL